MKVKMSFFHAGSMTISPMFVFFFFFFNLFLDPRHTCAETPLCPTTATICHPHMFFFSSVFSIASPLQSVCRSSCGFCRVAVAFVWPQRCATSHRPQIFNVSRISVFSIVNRQNHHQTMRIPLCCCSQPTHRLPRRLHVPRSLKGGKKIK